MTTRGKPLGGKYENIYEKTLKGGKRRFVVRIRYTNDRGRETNKTMTFRTLREAVAGRDRFLALRTTGQIATRQQQEKVTMGEMAARVLVTKRHLKSYRDIQWIIEGEYGIVPSFGEDFDLAGITEMDIEWFKREVLEKRGRRLPPGARKPGKASNGKPISNRTKNNYLMYLKTILWKAHRCGALRMVPEVAMYPVKNNRKLKIDLPTFMELVALMPEPPKPHKAMLLMGLYTAQRWGDLARMEKWQIQGPIVEGTPIAYRSSKTREDLLQIPMPKLLAQALNKLVPFSEENQPLLFANPGTGKPYSGLKKPIATACKKLGIQPFEFYQIRHLAATAYLTTMRDTNAVAHILGHRDSRMVDQRYGHLMKRHHPGVTALDEQLRALC